jgi:hypothetical protein
VQTLEKPPTNKLTRLVIAAGDNYAPKMNPPMSFEVWLVCK